MRLMIFVQLAVVLRHVYAEYLFFTDQHECVLMGLVDHLWNFFMGIVSHHRFSPRKLLCQRIITVV